LKKTIFRQPHHKKVKLNPGFRKEKPKSKGSMTLSQKSLTGNRGL